MEWKTLREMESDRKRERGKGERGERDTLMTEITD